MDDKQIYTTAKSEELKRQVKAFSKKFKEKYFEFKEKNKKTEKKLKPPPEIKSTEKEQNVSISAPEPQSGELEEETFYKKYLRRKSSTDPGDRFGIYTIFIYTILIVIVIIIVFSIYVTLPGNKY